MIKKFISLAAVAASIFGCSGSDAVAADGDGHVASGVKKGTMTDPRDGQVYKTVKIGTQTWMAENLNYQTDESYCHIEDPANCEKYGRLYTWSAAKNACPTGWHLPSKAEFKMLLFYVGSDGEGQGYNLCLGNCADGYGFSALPAGYSYASNEYGYIGHIAFFWSSTEYYSGYAYYLAIYDDHANVDYYNHDESYGHSVRCLQD